MKNSKTAVNTSTVSGKGAPPAKAPVKIPWKDRLSENDYEELKKTFQVFD